jgi:hypothetical protein
VALGQLHLTLLELGSDRNAIYMNRFFDARRRLRESFAAAGHQLGRSEHDGFA